MHRSQPSHRSPEPFFFNDTATTQTYTLSLHDALPLSGLLADDEARGLGRDGARHLRAARLERRRGLLPRVLLERRSEEHTSELQSRRDLVCRLLLEKKKKKMNQRQCMRKLTMILCGT